ncbi:hypothetical protein [Paenibacillus glycinis]|uniref:Uncharacterized protein n=1 Tax=Paenibacillus glycinis TaxID=2697035 RepID=A0ABW9XR71_9BACL|nr:hypothetical protein [Paenibacillus glycinis]NBD25144.1 hypothetical protein [Paenibacillus glycinis]
MKKTKQPGENISLKTKKNEDPAVMDWINAQSNLMDSLRYLIENEVQRNGVRNLQTCIPAERRALTGLESQANAEAAASGTRELLRVREEVSAGLSVPEEVPQADALLPEAGERAESEAQPPEDEEIDEDDIDSWL